MMDRWSATIVIPLILVAAAWIVAVIVEGV